jgi:hypothetical protein
MRSRQAVTYTLLSAGRHHAAEKALLILLATAVFD